MSRMMGISVFPLNFFPNFSYVHTITNRPKPGSDAGGHRRREPQRLMDANEIVVHREQRDGMRVIFDLF
jgi:hypothetical protein